MSQDLTEYPEPLEMTELRVVPEPREQPESLELRVQRDLKVREVSICLIFSLHSFTSVELSHFSLVSMMINSCFHLIIAVKVIKVNLHFVAKFSKV